LEKSKRGRAKPGRVENRTGGGSCQVMPAGLVGNPDAVYLVDFLEAKHVELRLEPARRYFRRWVAKTKLPKKVR
jgi:hypothetical protein